MCFSPLTLGQARELYAQSALRRQGEFVIYSAWQEVKHYPSEIASNFVKLDNEMKRATLVYALESYIEECVSDAEE